jgi:hypothetical protein
MAKAYSKAGTKGQMRARMLAESLAMALDCPAVAESCAALFTSNATAAPTMAEVTRECHIYCDSFDDSKPDWCNPVAESGQESACGSWYAPRITNGS